jgi:hypothetical protein
MECTATAEEMRALIDRASQPAHTDREEEAYQAEWRAKHPIPVTAQVPKA